MLGVLSSGFFLLSLLPYFPSVSVILLNNYYNGNHKALFSFPIHLTVCVLSRVEKHYHFRWFLLLFFLLVHVYLNVFFFLRQ